MARIEPKLEIAYKSVPVKLPVALLARAQDYAKSLNRTLSEVVELLLKDQLKSADSQSVRTAKTRKAAAPVEV